MAAAAAAGSSAGRGVFRRAQTGQAASSCQWRRRTRHTRACAGFQGALPEPTSAIVYHLAHNWVPAATALVARRLGSTTFCVTRGSVDIGVRKWRLRYSFAVRQRVSWRIARAFAISAAAWFCCAHQIAARRRRRRPASAVMVLRHRHLAVAGVPSVALLLQQRIYRWLLCRRNSASWPENRCRAEGGVRARCAPEDEGVVEAIAGGGRRSLTFYSSSVVRRSLAGGRGGDSLLPIRAAVASGAVIWRRAWKSLPFPTYLRRLRAAGGRRRK